MDGAAARATRSARHPIFARFFDRLSRSMERDVGVHRDRLLAGLRGRVLEVGAGNGINFAHYPATVEEVVAIEPEPYMRGKAQRAVERAPVPVRMIDAVACALPFGSGSFDAVVTSLVLCTVPDPEVALAEVRRVLKRDGELRFLEHVRADRDAKARVQALLDRSRIWPLLGGGCHCSRATVADIEAAGLRAHQVQTLAFGPRWWVTNPHVLGAARPVSGI